MTKWLIEPANSLIESIAGEPAVASCRLYPESIRERFRSPPAWQPEHGFDHRLLRPEQELKLAAVLILLVVRPEGLALLFTRRASQLTDHAGQISFPGGRVEALDHSAVYTALRETEEEIGLAPDAVDVLGSMPEWITGSGYRITPVVGLVHPPFSLLVDPREVIETFEIPMSFLMDGLHHQRRSIEISGGFGRRHFYSVQYERFFIWGATAGILRNLFHFLRA